MVKAIPDGYNTITPYIMVNDTIKFIDFVEKVFDAKVNHNMAHPDGKARHAEIQIGSSKIMISEASKENPATPVMLYLYLEDADAVYRKAIDYGAASIMEPRDTFYGDRNAGFSDHSGNKWWVATHVKDVDISEIEKYNQELKD